MTPPARRDGTPDKKQRDSDIIVSNAKPARHQHVSKKKQKATAESVARELGADWLVDEDKPKGERLQKVLAKAGVASRRHAEILIDAGRVEVNGKIISKQGVKVNPSVDVIRVDGVRVNVNEEHEYFVLNKPRGMQSTMSDDLGRPCVGDVVSEKVAAGQRLFHVGRLDADTEGLLILTNDGELANRLMHPKYEVTKTYLATVLGEADRKLVRQLKEGIELEDGLAKADFAQVVDTNQGYSLVRLELHEGRKHIVRRMLKEAGFPVQRLVRTKLHTVQLGDMKPGGLRALNSSELTSLYKAVEM
ncbi:MULTISPECIES: pseudouridine synthase [Corynebacterium]|uniref:Pseudouridine synthase n=1 Tax=Corynebacterium tuberculostearicum SK141 TaxID=553206 RepID=C6RBQ2_9CORY|nr:MULTISPECIES: pseudouridine synthase [Corynebacterium]EET76566.1 pseudouridylate synthase [Corynebacterium tuberculostearicum SK141]MCG7450510.1 rRNA pseudouridine synthase [Corynebacterium kefirresidentii]MCG7452748.1 rRNA pseudouridine synthase [Corynebacterium kefirresidentii]MCK6081919.1 rRNA pseudouridine synthase [Corynebacterium kefirresidentii]MCT2187533.1 rRNA pseudouridine synthase [Corynebacterium kefirresidentii]